MPPFTPHALALAGVAAMLLPHHTDSTGHPVSLASMLVDLVRDAARSPNASPLVALLMLLAFLSPLAPAALAVLTLRAGSAHAVRVTLALGVPALLALGAACAVAILMSDVAFGFGGGTHTGRTTPFTHLPPAFIALAAIAAAAGAIWPSLLAAPRPA